MNSHRLYVAASLVAILADPLLVLADADFPEFSAGTPQKLVDSRANDYTYAYAPAIWNDATGWHMFFCSSGADGSWDYIRHTDSVDMIHWSNPGVALAPSDSVNERAAC